MGYLQQETQLNGLLLGKKHDCQKKITEFKTLKPCICGSDPHKKSELFQRDDNRFCWIKA